jgi:Flp pilus assembly protein TadG
MQRRRAIQSRSGERGQTLVLFALSISVLIGMAALAIDATTLYVARGEMQRAADAAALAGAKAFVDSGVTTSNTTDSNYPNLQGLAQNMGTQIINSLLAQNTVGGTAPQLVGTPTFNFATHPGNPQITVTLQRTDVPTFFARIFGRTLATVSATATAEAYNSSLPPGGGGGMPPVAPSCVKPWLIPNADPLHSPDAFISPATGALVHPEIYPAGIIGEEITLLNDCKIGVLGLCSVVDALPIADGQGHKDGLGNLDGLDYLPAQLAAASGSCPSCAGGTDYEQSSACCDTANAGIYSCGASAPGVLVDLTTNIINNTVSSVECLISPGGGPGYPVGQDEIGLGSGSQPPADTFGNFLASNGNDPIELRAGGGPHAGQLVTTSPSIVTLPIYDTTGVVGLVLPVKIIGFMQAFVQQTDTGGNIQIYVLNISGCGPNVNTALTPIYGGGGFYGGGASPVPVRLIHN